MLMLPCGQCIGCRLERSRQWAVRCVHEASLHEDNCFITLTYDCDSMPRDFGLCKRDLQLFFKRVRKNIGVKLRYYACGEYGETTRRPHYHACLFGYRPQDLELLKERDGVRLYTSEFLQKQWKNGYVTVGDVTFESAAYVARYIMKKVNGEKAEDHYMRTDGDTGEVHEIQPEYTTMSRRPGIGRDWYEQFKSDAFPSDFIIMRGVKMKPPRYYDSLYEHIDQLKVKRRFKALKHAKDNTPQRLKVKETVKTAQITKLKRGL